MKPSDLGQRLNSLADRPKHWSHQRESFFKYSTPKAALAILGSRALRWSSPKNFNDPFDMQFDLQADIDHAKVRSRVLKSLWAAFYSARGIPVGNVLGETVGAVRSRFPKLSRENFNREFGEAFDEVILKLPSFVSGSNSEFQKMMEGTKVLCLSERHDSVLMWSHYAELHQGSFLNWPVYLNSTVFGVVPCE